MTENNTALISKCMKALRCIYRSDCHSCTEYLPHPAADCPRALPGKKTSPPDINSDRLFVKHNQ